METAQKIWIKEEINFLYSKLNDVNKSKEEMYNTIISQYHHETIEEISQYIQNWIKPILQKKKETHIRKLDNLIQCQKQNFREDNFTDIPEFYPKVKNLTKIKFTADENTILEKCLKYNINLDDKKTTIENDLTNIDAAIKDTDKNKQDPLRYNFIHELEKADINLRKLSIKKTAQRDMNIINSISNKLTENNAMITKADKGNTIVVIDKEDYDDKIQTFINNNTFSTLHKDPTPEFSKVTNKLISNCKSISKQKQYQLKMMNPKAPRLRGQPKTHKKEIPIRPVVNYQNCPTYKICKYLNNKIKNNIDWGNSYSLKNTTELVNKIKNTHIPDNSIFISFDIKDMYTNIPTKETLNILKEDLLQTNKLPNPEINDIIKLTKNCMDQNYFEYKSKFYKQENGLAMGSPLSGLLSDIFIHHLETNKIIHNSNPFHQKIIYWYRYVDDIICLLEGNLEDSEDLLKYLNSLSNSIKFTKETQQNNINFLDITIGRNKNHHTFKIFRKPTQTNLCIPSSSNHPWKYKISGFRSMINRLLNIPMAKNDYDKEVKIIKYLANKNGYTSKLIDKMIKTTTLKMSRKPPIFHNTNEKNYIKIPYNTTLNKAIRKTFNKTNYKISYETKNNALKIINSKLDPLPDTNDYNKPGIYKIDCSDCEKFYIGQTGRSFNSRFKEHIQALRSNNRTSIKSNYADHLLESNHNYTSMKDNMTILRYLNKGNKMDSCEELQIYMAHQEQPQNLLNNHLHTYNPIFEHIKILINKYKSTNPN